MVQEVDVFGAKFRYSASADTGVATRIEPLTIDGRQAGLYELEPQVEVTERATPLAFALRSCQRLSARRSIYDVQWRAPDDLELPITVTVSIGDGTATSHSLNSFGDMFEVDLAAEGVFTIVADEPPAPDSDGDEFLAASRELRPSNYCELRIVSEVYIDDQTEIGLEMEPYPDAPTVIAPAGTVQSLAVDDVPIGGLLRDLLLSSNPESDLFPDHWWLAPDAELDSISLSRNDACWRISTTYSEPAVQVLQSRGCDRWPASSMHDVVQIVDAAWDVTVAGPPAEVRDFIDAVVSVPVAGVEQLPAAGVAP
jgi:hypothetical protein